MQVTNAGGKLLASCTMTVTHVISTQAAVDQVLICICLYVYVFVCVHICNVICVHRHADSQGKYYPRACMCVDTPTHLYNITDVTICGLSTKSVSLSVYLSVCLSDCCNAVVTTSFDDLLQGGPVIKQVVERNLPVVTEAWIDKCISEGMRVSETGFLLRGEATEEAGTGKRKVILT
jgi:hypothetical protein